MSPSLRFMFDSDEVQKLINEILSNPLEELEQHTVRGLSIELPKKYQNVKYVGFPSHSMLCTATEQSEPTQGEPRKVEIRYCKNIFPEQPNTVVYDDVDRKHVLRECTLLMRLQRPSHPNLLNLIDIVQPCDFDSFRDVVLVTEWMPTDLLQILRSQNQELTSEHVRFFLYQLLLGLHFLHARGIIHRNLCPRAICLNENCDLKIRDFGIVRQDDFQSYAELGPHQYQPPESILYASLNDAGPSYDMWSVGCIFFDLCTRQVLFRGPSRLDVLKKMIAILGTPSEEDITTQMQKAKDFVHVRCRRSYGQDLRTWLPDRNVADEVALDLLTKMLQFNPRKRITTEEALRHPYFQELFDEADLTAWDSDNGAAFSYDFEERAYLSGIREYMYHSILEYKKSKMEEKIRADLRIEADQGESVPPGGECLLGSCPSSPLRLLVDKAFESKYAHPSLRNKLRQAGVFVS